MESNQRMKRIIFATVLILAGFFLTLYSIQEEKAPNQGGNPPPQLTVDDNPLEGVSGEAVASYADVLENVTPAVVSVFSTKKVRAAQNNFEGHPFFNDPMFRRFFGIPDEAPGEGNGNGGREEVRPLGLGSGVIVTKDGYILTNNHVIEGADEVKVRLTDGREFTATIVGSDKKTDVAVIRIDGDQLPALALANSDRLRVGDVVFAVGHPLQVGLTVTMGIVSATGRSNLGIIRSEGAYEDFIQTDASINPGNSGGPLVDARGRVVGINTAILSRSGGNIGIGFAIPSNLARRVMENLIQHGSVQRGFLGIRLSDASQEMVSAFGLPDNQGALVEQVLPGLPAEKAGIQHGDFIIKVNERRIRSAGELRAVISQISPGSTVDITVIRNGEEKTFSVTLGDADSQAVASATGSTAVNESLIEGVTLAPLDESLRTRYNIPKEVNGIVITAVGRDSFFARVLREGMVIREWNKTPVDSLEKASAVKTSGVNLLWIFFNGSTRFISLKLD
jgi:serine protease Do